MTRIPREKFLALLADLGDWIKDNDSMEGSLQYVQEGPDEYEVGCALRFGNSMGQGSVRILEWDPEREPVQGAPVPPTALLVFGELTVQVDGHWSWVVAALEGKVGPDTILMDDSPIAVPPPDTGQMYHTPASLFGFTGVLLTPDGRVRRVTLRNTETGEPAWVNVDNLLTVLPGTAF